MGDIVTINNIKYRICARYALPEKAANMDDVLGVKVQIVVEEVATGKVLTWKEMKGTYLANKISDYIQNTINGQRTFYWKNK